MYRVSPEYKKLMREQVREHPTKATISFGLFDDTAAGDASLSWSDVTSYSVPANVNTSEAIRTSYATFESNQLRMDGGQTLVPSTGQYERQGFISSVLSGDDGWFLVPPFIDFRFSFEHEIVGLTMEFDKQYSLPAQITVVSYRGEDEVTRDTVTDFEYRYVGQFLFDGVDRIMVTFDRMQHPNNRARVNNIAFGIGYEYSDGILKSITEKHSGSPLSLKLPTSTLSFELFNEDKQFSLESETALQRFLAEGQRAVLNYKIANQTVPSGIWRLSDWSVQGANAKFNLKSPLALLNETTYEISDFDNREHSLGIYAENVLSDAGVTDHYIDPYLYEVMTKSPIPIVSHAEALQLIANAGGCQLSVDRNGKISFVRIRNVRVDTTVTSATQQTPYSNVDEVEHPGNEPYATFEPSFLRMDGTQRLVPTAGDYNGSGWVGMEPSRANGTYPDNDVVLNFDNPTNVFQVFIDWGSETPPLEAIISCRVDGVWTEETIIYPSDNQEYYPVAFTHTDGVRIQHLRASVPGQRPRIKYASTSLISDFIISEDQVFEGFKSTMEPKLRDVITEYYIFVPGETDEIVTTEGMTNTTLRVEHDLCLNPTIAVTVEDVPQTDVSVTAVHHAYVSYITLASPADKMVEVAINGTPVEVTERRVTSNAGDVGEDMEIENPLLSSQQTAMDVAEWVRDYYSHRITYDDEIRGFPEIDLFDAVYLTTNEAGLITASELKYNGAFRQKLTIRKGAI